MGAGDLPAGVNLRHVLGGAALGGVGFTVAHFIAELSFTDEVPLADAKVGILFGSVIAGVAGIGILLLPAFKRSKTPPAI